MNPEQTDDVLNADELHCAFLIDEHGNEVPITRDMIDSSCNGLAFSTCKSTTKADTRQ